jgi:hypothetical protein
VANKLSSQIECYYCDESFEYQYLAINHYSGCHSSKLKQLYLDKNYTRQKLSQTLNVTEGSVKEILRQTGITKEWGQVVSNSWSSMLPEARIKRSQQARLTRLDTYKNSTHLLQRHKEVILIGSQAAAKAKKLRSEEAKLDIFKLLDDGFSLDYSYKIDRARRVFKEWRQERGTVFCDICSSRESGWKWGFVLDHCHVQNIVRGLLCHQCNAFLGWVEKRQEKIDGYLSKGDLEFEYRNDLLHWDGFPWTVGDKMSCEICGVEKVLGQYSILIDHNHRTGKVRGFLCHSCNLKLGKFESGKNWLQYLENERVLGKIIL